MVIKREEKNLKGQVWSGVKCRGEYMYSSGFILFYFIFCNVWFIIIIMRERVRE